MECAFTRTARYHVLCATAALIALLALAAPARARYLSARGNGIGDGSSNLYRVVSYDSTPSAMNTGEAGVKLFDLAIHISTRENTSDRSNRPRIRPRLYSRWCEQVVASDSSVASGAPGFGGASG